jgi:hypothetical protein
MNVKNVKTVLACVFVGAVVTNPAGAAIQVFSDNGNVTMVGETVTAFRDALGTLNPNTPANFADGRREINWDGVPDASADPNPFPGDFFNGTTAGRARGIQFSTPGTGFLVSANAGAAVPTGFGFADEFIPFSAQRMFSPVGSTITDVIFFNPALNTQRATTRAFGAVFEDVEERGSTMSFYDPTGNLLLTIDVPRGSNAELSFAGAAFDAAVIGRVRISAGNAALLANGVFGPGTDGVVMDDFIFGELVPVPEPRAYALMIAGLALIGLAARAKRRR